MSNDCQKVSKLLRGLSAVLVKLNLPPNSCMPNKAKIMMNRNRSSSKLTMDLIEFNSDATKFLSADQYLKGRRTTMVSF